MTYMLVIIQTNIQINDNRNDVENVITNSNCATTKSDITFEGVNLLKQIYE